MLACVPRCPQDPEGGIESFGGRIPGTCELFNVGSKIRTLVLIGQ